MLAGRLSSARALKSSRADLLVTRWWSLVRSSASAGLSIAQLETEAERTSPKLEDPREPQTKVNNFEERVVAIAEDLIVELHDRAAPEVVHAIFHLVFNDAIENILEDLPKVLGSLPSLGRVLGEVLQHSPQIQQRTPVNITKVREEQVLLKVIH